MVGVAGCVVSFKEKSDYIPTVRTIVDSSNQVWQKPGVNNNDADCSDDFPYALYAVLTPETGKYDLFNATLGTYYEYQMDEVAQQEGEAIKIKQDGKYGLVDKKGVMLYKSIYDSIDTWIYSMDDEVGYSRYFTDMKSHGGSFFVAKSEKGTAILTENASTDGNVFYRDITDISNDLIGVRVDTGLWGVLSLRTGEYVVKCKYDGLTEPKDGYFVGTRWIDNDEYSPYAQSKCEIISEDGTVDINGIAGGKYANLESDSIQDGLIYVHISDFEYQSGYYEGSYKTFFEGYIDFKGNQVFDCMKYGKAVKARRNLFLVEHSKHKPDSDYDLLDREGKVVLEHIRNVETIGNYILVRKDVGYFILDPKTCEVLVEDITSYYFKDYLEKIIRLGDDDLHYGFFDMESGAFSGFNFKGDADYESLQFESAFSDAECAIWRIDNSVYTAPSYASSDFDKIDPDFTYSEATIRPSMTIIYEDKDGGVFNIRRTRIVNTKGEIIADFVRDIRHENLFFKQCMRSIDEDSKKIGLIRDDGTVLLEKEFSKVSGTWQGLTYADKGYAGEAGVIDINGDCLVYGKFCSGFSRYWMTENIMKDSSLILQGEDEESYYFYNFSNILIERTKTDVIKVEDTSPKSGSADVNLKASNDIRITFNQDVNIFNNSKIGDIGKIEIKEYDTDKTVLEYRMLSNSNTFYVKYKSSKDKSTIVLKNALTVMTEGTRYYVLIDGHCVTAAGNENNWFKGISGKNTLSFSVGLSTQKESDVTYLAACELVNRGAVQGVGGTVNEFLKTEYYKDESIWKNGIANYSVLFKRLLGGYEIIDVVEATGSRTGYVALKAPEGEHMIVVLFGKKDTELKKTYLKESYILYQNFLKNYKNYSVILTGEKGAGVVAAYISAIENQAAVTFNSPIKAGLDMAFLYNSNVILKYEGIENLPCLNYSNNLFSAWGNGGYHNKTIKNNKDGSAESLNALLQYEDNFHLTSLVKEDKPDKYIQRTLHNEKEAFGILKAFMKSDILEALVSGGNAILSKGHALYLGTSQADGLATKAVSPFRAQIVYSGGSNGGTDKIFGKLAENIFSYSGGNADIHGNRYRDLYYINGTGNVTITDYGSEASVSDEIMKIVETMTDDFDLTSIKKFADVASALEKLTNLGIEDTIFVNTSEVSYSQVAFENNRYIINLGDSTITVNPGSKNHLIVLKGLNDTVVYLQAANFAKAKANDIINEEISDGQADEMMQDRLADAEEGGNPAESTEASTQIEDCLLDSVLLKGSSLNINVYIEGQLVESTQTNEGSVNGQYFYTGVSEDSDQVILCVNDQVDYVEITGDYLEEILSDSPNGAAMYYRYETGDKFADGLTINYASYSIYQTGKEETILSEEMEEIPQKEVTGLSLIPPAKVDYTVGEMLNTEGLEVYKCYSDGSSEKIENYEITGYNAETEGEQEIIISDGDVSNSFMVQVHPEGELVTEIRVDKALEMKEDEIKELNITTIPELKDEETLIFISSDNEVVMARGSCLQAIKPGTATITIKDSLGLAEAACEVTVLPLSDEDRAATVRKMISSIGFASGKDKDKIERARAAYNSLTDAQKELVSNYDQLLRAEKDYGNNHAVQDIRFENDSVAIEVGKSKTLIYSMQPPTASCKITWSSSDESIASVDNEGTVHAKKCGETIISIETENGLHAECRIIVKEHIFDGGKVAKQATCTAKGTKLYTCTECGYSYEETIEVLPHAYKTITTKATLTKNGSSVKKCSVCGRYDSEIILYYPKTINLSAFNYTYNGKVQKPSITVIGSDGKTISSSNYTVTYSGGKGVGSYTATIVFKGNYSGAVTKAFKILPKGTSISKVIGGKQAFTVKWKKQAKQTTGYQIQYSTNKRFKKGIRTVTVAKNKKTSRKIGSLKPKKKYYVRVRTYKTVKINGRSSKLYSRWSKTKKIRTK